MNKIYFILPLLILSQLIVAQAELNIDKQRVYLIPGQGADMRLYDKLQIDSSFKTIHVVYTQPHKNQTMHEYAIQLATQIDTTVPFYLIGVSLGGMLSVELSEMVRPRKTIIISSAKHKNEIPGRYKSMKKIPINQIIPPGLYKVGAKIAQPIVEPDRKLGKETFKGMLNDKDPKFLKYTSNMIIRWERTSYPINIVHIHGDNDHTLPVSNVKADYLIENGSHMMVYTRGDEISRLVNKILLE